MLAWPPLESGVFRDPFCGLGNRGVTLWVACRSCPEEWLRMSTRRKAGKCPTGPWRREMGSTRSGPRAPRRGWRRGRSQVRGRARREGKQGEKKKAAPHYAGWALHSPVGRGRRAHWRLPTSRTRTPGCRGMAAGPSLQPPVPFAPSAHPLPQREGQADRHCMARCSQGRARREPCSCTPAPTRT